jgi:5-methylcytosine-specific restriction endonuclease McrA
MVLQRDSWQCQLKLDGICTSVADCVHHTHGRSITGDDPAHLVAACTPCNLKTGDPTRQPDPPPRPRTRW